MNAITTLRDLVRGFADAMNLISPEVQNHHEKVAYLAWQLAREMGMEPRQQELAFIGALLHDIGSVVKQQNLTLKDLELNARSLSRAGGLLLQGSPFTRPLSQIVQNSQTPWQRLRAVPDRLKTPLYISQIIHLADAVTLMLAEGKPVLNQVGAIRDCVFRLKDAEFCPEVLSGFEALCRRESVWMDMMYRPDRFLELIAADRGVSLDEAITLTQFMSVIIDFRSPFTAMHSAGVAATATCLAEKIGMSSTECKMMRIAGYLHDVGKLKIPNEILEKPGKLTDEEFNVMKEHAYYTFVLLSDIRGFEQITAWAAFHHEKLDGNGYPFHLRADELSLGSRVMAVADIFSAVTEDRPYRKGMAREKVIDILRQDAGKGLISSSVVELLISNFDEINAAREAESRAASKKYQESLKES